MNSWREQALQALDMNARLVSTPVQIQHEEPQDEQGLAAASRYVLAEELSQGRLQALALDLGDDATGWIVAGVGGDGLGLYLRRSDQSRIDLRHVGLGVDDAIWDDDDAGVAVRGAPGGTLIVWTANAQGLLVGWTGDGRLRVATLEDAQPRRLLVCPPGDLPDSRAALAGVRLPTWLAEIVYEQADRDGLGPAMALGLVLHLADPVAACDSNALLSAMLAGSPDPLEHATLGWLAGLDDAERRTLLVLADAALGALYSHLDQAADAPTPWDDHWADQVLDLVRARDDLEALACVLRLGGLHDPFDAALLSVDQRLFAFLGGLPETLATTEARFVHAVADGEEPWWLRVLSCPAV